MVSLQSRESSNQKKWEPSASWIEIIRLKRSSKKNIDVELDLLSIPRGTLSGSYTFIRWDNRSVGAITVLQTGLGLAYMHGTRVETIDEEQDGN